MEECRVEASANPETCQKPGFEVGIFFEWIFRFLVDFLFLAVWQIWLKFARGTAWPAAGGTGPAAGGSGGIRRGGVHYTLYEDIESEPF